MIEYSVPTEELAAYLMHRWEGVPDSAKALLCQTEEQQTFWIMLWEIQYWRMKNEIHENAVFAVSPHR